MKLRDLYTKKEWETFRIQAAISIMQGIQESGKVGTVLELIPKELSHISIIRATELMNELANEEI